MQSRYSEAVSAVIRDKVMPGESPMLPAVVEERKVEARRFLTILIDKTFSSSETEQLFRNCGKGMEMTCDHKDCDRTSATIAYEPHPGLYVNLLCKKKSHMIHPDVIIECTRLFEGGKIRLHSVERDQNGPTTTLTIAFPDSPNEPVLSFTLTDKVIHPKVRGDIELVQRGLDEHFGGGRFDVQKIKDDSAYCAEKIEDIRRLLFYGKL